MRITQIFFILSIFGYLYFYCDKLWEFSTIAGNGIVLVVGGVPVPDYETLRNVIELNDNELSLSLTPY